MANLEKLRKKREENWMIKADINDKKIMDDIRIERIKKGLDNELLPYHEIISASFRFDPLINILKEAEIKRKVDKR